MNVKTITEYLEEFKDAVLGRDVKQGLIDCIEQCYKDGRAGTIDLIARSQVEKKADKTEVAALTARMDILTGEPDGNVNTELNDIRADYKGKVHPTAGDAVRAQVSDLHEKISELEEKDDAVIRIDTASIGTIGQAVGRTGGPYHVNDRQDVRNYVIDISGTGIKNCVLKISEPAIENPEILEKTTTLLVILDEGDVVCNVVTTTAYQNATYTELPGDGYLYVDISHVFSRFGSASGAGAPAKVVVNWFAVNNTEPVIEIIRSDQCMRQDFGYPFVQGATFATDKWSMASLANAISDIRIFDTTKSNIYISYSLAKINLQEKRQHNTVVLECTEGTFGQFEYDRKLAGETTINITNGTNIVGTVTLDPGKIFKYEPGFNKEKMPHGSYETCGISESCKVDYALFPENIFICADYVTNLYLKNITKGNINNYFVRAQDNDGFPHGWKFNRRQGHCAPTDTTKGTRELKVEMDKLNGTPIDVYSVRSCRTQRDALTGETINALFIGDSLIAGGNTTEYLLELCETENITLKLHGTKGSGANKREGYAGWSSYDVTHQYDSSNKSSFIGESGKFDFEGYCEKNNITELDWVFVQLGVNDIFRDMQGTSTIDNLNIIINGIRSVFPGCKIGIAQPPQPYMGGTVLRNDWRPAEYAHLFRLNIAMQEKLQYGGREDEGIYLIPIYAVVDTDNNFPMDTRNVNEFSTEEEEYCTDITHYKYEGHKQVAVQYLLCMKYYAD